MMNNFSMIGLIVFIVLAMGVTFAGNDESTTDTVKQADLIVLSRTVYNPSEMEEYDLYHESDDILLDNNEFIIYFNQTSPVTDTMYVYHLVVEY